MIPLGIVASARTAPPAGPPPLIADTFTRPDGPLQNTYADTGQQWWAIDTRMVISSGAVRSTTGGDNLATINAGTPDVIVEWDLIPEAPGIILRAVDNPLYNYRVRIIQDGTIEVSYKATGAYVLIQSAKYTGTPSKGRVRAVGAAVDVWINDELMLTGVPIVEGVTRTYMGVYRYNSHPATVDNLKVWAA